MTNQNMVKHAFGTKSQIESTSRTEGCVYFSTDNQSIYFDHNGELNRITDIVEIDTEEEMKALLAPKSKFYYCKDTGNLWRRLNGEWQIMGGPKLSEAIIALQDKTSNLEDDSVTNIGSKDYESQDISEVTKLSNNGSTYVAQRSSNVVSAKTVYSEYTTFNTAISKECEFEIPFDAFITKIAIYPAAATTLDELSPIVATINETELPVFAADFTKLSRYSGLEYPMFVYAEDCDIVKITIDHESTSGTIRIEFIEV